jgi:dipeptidyl aminopeptidase/acylaminoacyl peptidase
MSKQSLPFGLWPSPVTPELLGAKLRLDDIQFDSDGETLVWLEGRDGRGVLVAQRGHDAPRDISGGVKVRAGVGYGGGDFTVRNGMAVFSGQGRLYRVPLGHGAPQPVTPEFGDAASPVISPDGSQILFVHSYERADCLALVDAEGKNWPTKLASSADFYMQPTWHPNSKQIAWIEWDHPQMPWDGTRLMSARLNGSELTDVKKIFGGVEVPVFQPAFSPDGRCLAFLANNGEWDSLYTVDLVSGKKRILVKGATLIDPAWAQGLRTIAWSADLSRIFYLKNDKGWRTLWAVETASGESKQIDVAPYTWMTQLTASSAGDTSINSVQGQLALIASSPQTPDRIVFLENGKTRILRRSSSESLDPDELASPKPIEWSAPDGTMVKGLYYPPTNMRCTADGLPPAIVNIHGGPTSACTSRFNTQAAFFATRGYAYLEVNYRGSTGYGRSYMLMLRQQWGLLDTEDAVGGAEALAALGYADPQRMVVMGASAGGYTVLNALERFPGVFKAGIDLFGVANLFDFLIGTHKFEERYNDSLVGILPQDAERFKAWSPALHVDKIKDPIAVFQGADDKVVPPEHSEQIVAILRANKVPYVYKLYPGEGHGWRKTETIVDFYNTVDRFLKQYVLF